MPITQSSGDTAGFIEYIVLKASLANTKLTLDNLKLKLDERGYVLDNNYKNNEFDIDFSLVVGYKLLKIRDTELIYNNVWNNNLKVVYENVNKCLVSEQDKIEKNGGDIITFEFMKMLDLRKSNLTNAPLYKDLKTSNSIESRKVRVRSLKQLSKPKECKRSKTDHCLLTSDSNAPLLQSTSYDDTYSALKSKSGCNVDNYSPNQLEQNQFEKIQTNGRTIFLDHTLKRSKLVETDNNKQNSNQITSTPIQPENPKQYDENTDPFDKLDGNNTVVKSQSARFNITPTFPNDTEYNRTLGSGDLSNLMKRYSRKFRNLKKFKEESIEQNSIDGTDNELELAIESHNLSNIQESTPPTEFNKQNVNFQIETPEIIRNDQATFFSDTQNSNIPNIGIKILKLDESDNLKIRRVKSTSEVDQKISDGWMTRITKRDVDNFLFNLITKYSIEKILKCDIKLEKYYRSVSVLDKFISTVNKGLSDKNLKEDDNIEYQKRLKEARKTFLSYMNMPEFVKFANMMIEKNELPLGWVLPSSKNRNKSDLPYYIDDNSKSTTYFHPNIINFDISKRKKKEIQLNVLHPEASQFNYQTTLPPINEPTTIENDENETQEQLNTQDDAYDLLTSEERHVLFFQHADSERLIEERYPRYNDIKWLRDTVKQIKKEGLEAYRRAIASVHAYQFTLMISTLDDVIDSFDVFDRDAVNNSLAESEKPRTTKIYKKKDATLYIEELEKKQMKFYEELKSRKYAQAKLKLCLTNVPRKFIANAVRGAINKAPPVVLQRCKMQVSFENEEGIDFTGPLREMFHLVSKETFDPYKGLFEYASDNQNTVQLASQILVSGELTNSDKEWFKFSGRLIGLALLHRALIDVYFTRCFYRGLMQKPYILEDIQSVDEDFYKNTRWLLDNQLDGLDLGLTFEADREILGGYTAHKELKPGGKDINVDDSNKIEYINLLIKWRTDFGTKEAMNEIVSGFSDVLPIDLVSKYFDPKELELVLCGLNEIDVKDWKCHTEYRDGYNKNSVTVRHFWQIVSTVFDNEERVKLLQFVTGSSSLPHEGFKGLRGPNGKKLFCIQRWGNAKKDLPRSHTCFNRLDLPDYGNKAVLLQKLKMAIYETAGFNIE